VTNKIDRNKFSDPRRNGVDLLVPVNLHIWSCYFLEYFFDWWLRVLFEFDDLLSTLVDFLIVSLGHLP